MRSTTPLPAEKNRDVALDSPTIQGYVPFFAIASGAMLFASTGVNNAWPLAWLAPVPLLVVVPDLRWRGAAVAAFAASVLGALNLAVAYHDLPPPLIVGAILFVAAPFTAVVLAWRAIARRGRPVLTAIAFSALMAAADYLVQLASPNGTFGSLAYSQSDVPVVIQVASVTGIAGITFIVSLLPAAIALAWRHRRDRAVVTAVLLSALIPVVLALGFGAWRLAASNTSRTGCVGLAASDAAVRYFGTTDAAAALPAIHEYGARVSALARRGARIVVLPEKFVGVTPAYADEARQILSDAAKQHNVMIVAGLNRLGTAVPRNTAVVFDAGGRVVLEYDKQHLVPGLEREYRAGHDIGMTGAMPGVGVAICKDLDFAPLGRAYGLAGAGLLLVPAWDFVRDGWAHSRMAVLRGVEGGFAVARSAAQGRLTVSDANGRILAERSTSEAPDVLLTAVVPIGAGRTFYSRTGDWFAWTCIAAAALCLLVPRR